MQISKAERSQIENEMIFRRKNEKVVDDLEDLDAMHSEEGDPHLMSDDDLSLRFMCECSDENCTDRINMRPSKYRELHTSRRTFIVKTGHQVDPIEEVVAQAADYNVVVKKDIIAEPGDTLNETTIDNC